MTRERQPGWWYPWIFVVGMAVVIVVNVSLAVFAVGTFTGIETKEHYRKGLAYNTAIEAERKQAERGWSMDIDVSSEARGSGPREAEVATVFLDSSGRPLDGLTVSARFVRPTHEGHDVKAELAPRGFGRYAAVVTVPLPGQWDARVEARRDDEVYRENRRVFLPR